jgi:uncharacterized protein
MTNLDPASRINVQTFAESGLPMKGRTPIEKLARLAFETVALEPAPGSSGESPINSAVNWQAQAELRQGPAGAPDIWLHLQADAAVPVTCQRCLSPVTVPIAFERWYRFVENEDVAMAQDNESDEDLLVMQTQLDLLALLEDELIMALPMLPMHDVCPSPPQLSAGQIDVPEGVLGDPPERPNPFAALAGLKKNGKDPV